MPTCSRSCAAEDRAEKDGTGAKAIGRLASSQTATWMNDVCAAWLMTALPPS